MVNTSWFKILQEQVLTQPFSAAHALEKSVCPSPLASSGHAPSLEAVHAEHAKYQDERNNKSSSEKYKIISRDPAYALRAGMGARPKAGLQKKTIALTRDQCDGKKESSNEA